MESPWCKILENYRVQLYTEQVAAREGWKVPPESRGPSGDALGSPTNREVLAGLGQLQPLYHEMTR